MQDETSPEASPTVSRIKANRVAAQTEDGVTAADTGGRAQADPARVSESILREAGKTTASSEDDGPSITSRSRADDFRLLANPTWQDLLSFVLSLGAVISIVAVLVLLGWDTLRHTIDIEPILVPKSFADDKGFGPEVASRRLQDAYMALTRIDHPSVAPQTRPVPPSSLENRDVDVFPIPGQRAGIIQQSDLPAITLPGVAASLDSFAVAIQNFLGLGRRLTISGEFTVFENHLGLVLRTIIA